MLSGHGNVQFRAALPHPSYPRFVAVVDVLGMKAWLEKDSARAIAEALDVALVACDQSSCGQTSDGVSYGPLIQVIHFSDTVIAWSPDDSWASFSAMCSSLKMIVGVALFNGVPLRGSISHGDVVCNRITLKFVGEAIADAYLWSERNRPYKSVGVDLTPATIRKLREKMNSQPLPAHWARSLDPEVVRSQVDCGDLLVWHSKCLFVNHWRHGMFLRADPAELFLKRGLPVAAHEQADVDMKLAQLRQFYIEQENAQQRNWERYIKARPQFDASAFEKQQRDYVTLDELRKARN